MTITKAPAPDLNWYADKIHAAAVKKGFWDDAQSLARNIACMHCELSEAIQEDRMGRPLLYVDDIETLKRVRKIEKFNGRKPEGIAVELADFVMRLLDWAAATGVKLEPPQKPYYSDKQELVEIVNPLHQLVCELTAPEAQKDNAKIIRYAVSKIYSWLEYRGYDLFQIITLKMRYNESRPRLHGRRY